LAYRCPPRRAPLAKDIDDFDFADTPVNEPLVWELATGTFVADQRNVVLVGGTGTGKSHLAIASARPLIRNGTHGRFFNVVDLVNRLETETRSGKQGRTADYLNRLDFIILDEPGDLPLRRRAANSCSNSSAGSISAPRSSSPRTWPSANGRRCSVTPR